MEIIINIKRDKEASVYIAVCDEIGLALEDKSFTTLLKRVRDAVPEMAKENNVDCSNAIIIDDTDVIHQRGKKGNREAFLRILENVSDEGPGEDDFGPFA